MKNKLLSYMAGFGVSFCSVSVGNGCTGICGSCRMNCIPGLAMLVILFANVLIKKLRTRAEHSNG